MQRKEQYDRSLEQVYSVDWLFTGKMHSESPAPASMAMPTPHEHFDRSLDQVYSVDWLFSTGKTHSESPVPSSMAMPTAHGGLAVPQTRANTLSTTSPMNIPDDGEWR